MAFAFSGINSFTSFFNLSPGLTCIFILWRSFSNLSSSPVNFPDIFVFIFSKGVFTIAPSDIISSHNYNAGAVNRDYDDLIYQGGYCAGFC